jgi:hypothetical protein
MSFFNVKLGTEDILKPITMNESLPEASTHNVVRLVEFAKRKILF